MIADMHRARHLAWELPDQGWDVEILAPDISYQQPACIDDDSALFFPPEGIITYAPSFLQGLFRRFGIRTIGWRALVPMFWTGCKILHRRHIDVVYISTTQFSLFLLGPLWHLIFRIPYVLDIHDPCVKEDNAPPLWMKANWKYGLTRLLLKRVEEWATQQAAAVIAVSPGYIELLRRRHGVGRPKWSEPGRTQVIPFGALERDITEAASRAQRHREAAARVVYVGAGGPIMARAFSAFCEGLAELSRHSPELAKDVRIDLYGTVLGWETAGGTKDLEVIATRYGLAGIVRESPGRVSYRRSLELLLDADGGLILGVDDRDYMPSKLFSYALSGKPLLAVLRHDGPAYSVFRERPELGEAVWFDPAGTMPLVERTAIIAQFLWQCRSRQRLDRQAALAPFSASAMAEHHARLFAACLTTQ